MKHSSEILPIYFRELMWKKEFDTSYVGFMKDGAQWLVDNTDIKLVGEPKYMLISLTYFIFLFLCQGFCKEAITPDTTFTTFLLGHQNYFCSHLYFVIWYLFFCPNLSSLLFCGSVTKSCTFDPFCF